MIIALLAVVSVSAPVTRPVDVGRVTRAELQELLQELHDETDIHFGGVTSDELGVTRAELLQLLQEALLDNMLGRDRVNHNRTSDELLQEVLLGNNETGVNYDGSANELLELLLGDYFAEEWDDLVSPNSLITSFSRELLELLLKEEIEQDNGQIWVSDRLKRWIRWAAQRPIGGNVTYEHAREPELDHQP